MMRYLKMLPGAPAPVENPVWIDSVLTVTSDEAGVFYPRVKRGDLRREGHDDRCVTDFFGRTVFEARAPAAGVVLYICGVPCMTKGDTIASIGVVASSPP